MIAEKMKQLKTLNVIFLAVVVCIGLWPNQGWAKDNVIGDAFGVNIHLRQRHTESDWSEVLTLASDAGVQWGREQFNWDVIEPSDDSYNFETYDAVVDAYEAADIQMVGLLTYSSSWASDNPGATDYEFYPPDLDAWSDYVETVTQQYAGRVTYWEIWNEPNYAGFWYGDASDYADLLETAITAVQAGSPDAKIVLGGLSGADYDFLDDVLSQLNDPTAVQVIAMHPYRTVNGDYNYGPEDSVDGLNSLPTDVYNMKAVMNRYDLYDTPLWFTEVGWQTGADGVSERRQAEYLTRLYTMALAIPDVEKIFWYSLVDTSDDEAVSDAQFGLFEGDLTPKQAETAFRFVATELADHWLKSQTIPVAHDIDRFGGSLGWHFAGTVCTDGEMTDHDNGKMFVSYTFTADTNCYAPITLGKELMPETKALQFRAKGDNNSTVLRVRVIDSTGETFQYNFGYLPKEWLYYTVQLNHPASWWNGNGDGKLDQPLTFDSFILDDADGLQESGTLQIDDFISSKKGNVYQYRFHQGTKDKYAYWTSAKERKVLIWLAGVGRITERIWRYDDVKYTGNGYYKLRARNGVTFLQTR